MSGPQTEAGRALAGALAEVPHKQFPPPSGYTFEADILAIEREAVAVFLASPEAAEGLARAVARSGMTLGTPVPVFTRPKVVAAAILAAWQKEREG